MIVALHWSTQRLPGPFLCLCPQAVSKSDLETTCESKVTSGDQLLNPCGLIANSYFTGKAGLLRLNI
jgi:hypothetical protein